MALTALKGTLSSFAGSAISDWAVQRAARQWGIFEKPAKDPKDFLKSVGNVVGDEFTSIFTKGPKKVLSAGHVESIEFVKRTTISDAPQENGAFLSYDKVQQPYVSTVRFICDGSETGNIGENLLPGFVKGLIGAGPDKVKKDFIAALEKLVLDTRVYHVATPQKIYDNANIISYRFHRTPETADMIVADVIVQEVRQTRTTGWTNSRNPQGAKKENGGTVTPEKK